MAIMSTQNGVNNLWRKLAATFFIINQGQK